MARKPPAPKSGKPSKRSKLTVLIDQDLHGRLAVYAAFRRERLSAVVARAVEAELRSARFVCYQGSGPADGAPPAPGDQDGPQEPRGGPATVPAVFRAG